MKKYFLILFVVLVSCTKKSNYIESKDSSITNKINISPPRIIEKSDSCYYYTKGYYNVGRLIISNYYKKIDSLILDLNKDKTLDTVILIKPLSHLRFDEGSQYCFDEKFNDYSKLIVMSNNTRTIASKNILIDGYEHFKLKKSESGFILKGSINGVISFYSQTFIRLDENSELIVDSIILSNETQKAKKIIFNEKRFKDLSERFIDSFRIIENI